MALILVISVFIFTGINTESDETKEIPDELISDHGENDHSRFLMYELPPVPEDLQQTADKNPQRTSKDDLPDSFSWKNKDGQNWITPVKDQGQCGSCWDFAAIAAFESAIKIAFNDSNFNPDLSEQYVLSCLDAGGCGGGWAAAAIHDIKSTDSDGNGINGCTIENCMEYEANDDVPCADKCEDWDYHTEPPMKDNKLFQIDSWDWTDEFHEGSQDHWETIKDWIYNYGPVATFIYFEDLGTWGQNHHSSTDVYENDDAVAGHEVLVVGWKDDENITHGGYWICKNSWGTNWGYDGYFNVAYGLCGFGTNDVTWVVAEETTIPTARFSFAPAEPDISEPVTFNASESYDNNPDGYIANYHWDFDDGSNGTGETITHNFTGNEYYDVTLTVVDNDGYNDSITKEVEVGNKLPVANFYYEPRIVYIHDRVDFYSHGSYDPDGSIVSYHWDFGDGNTSTLENPTTIYPTTGDYLVSLTVTDDLGGIGTVNKTVSVKEEIVDVNQSLMDRGYPIRHTIDGDWSGAQNFTPTLNWLSHIELYLRTLGRPSFNLSVELRKDSIYGPVIASEEYLPAEVDDSWTWFSFDFFDINVSDESDLFIVICPPPSGVTDSNGYEWGYVIGDYYWPGSFWFTRDGGTFWRDLPTMYDFTFKTYGYN